MRASLKDKLLKLYTLSKRGVDGEKANAELLLQKMLDKYNLTMDDIDEDIPKKRRYRYTSKQNEQIISQVVFKIVNSSEVYISRGSKVVIVEATDYQHVQIIELVDYHITKYNKERRQFLNDFTTAYVLKHRLFRETDDEEKENRPPLTPEERAAIMRMSHIKDILNNDTYQKKIG